MDDGSKGACTYELIIEVVKVNHVPLFDFIPMDRVVIDTLHLFLRISDVLTQLLIQDLRIVDCIEKIKSSRKGLIEVHIHTWPTMSNL